MDWKSVIASIAPSLATALGGPLAGTAVGAISQIILGKTDGTEDEISQAISSGLSPETILGLKQAEQNFQIEVLKQEVEKEKVFAGDRASARQREKDTGDTWTPRLLGALIISGWFYIQWFFLNYTVPIEMREIILRGLGTLDLAVGLVLGYYFGSSAGSARKTALLNKKEKDETL